MKICTKCNKEVELGLFSNTKQKKDGTWYLNSWCNPCRSKQNRERLGSTQRKVPFVSLTEKECLDCNLILPFEMFRVSSRGRYGLAAYCISCQNIRSQTIYKDLEKARQSTNKYRKTHHERWKALHRLHQFNRKSKIKVTSDGSVTDQFIKELLSKTHCCWCNQATSPEKRTIEHVVELSNGGNHSTNNLAMSCLSCNSSRPNRNNKFSFEELFYGV